MRTKDRVGEMAVGAIGRARRLVGWCRQVAWRLGHERDGAALLEATLVIPVALALFIGIAEFSQALTVNRRVETAAGTAADLVARHQQITTTELAGVKPLLDEILRPYATGSLAVVLTSVTFNDTGQGLVNWSHANGPGAIARAQGTPVALPSGLAKPGASVIFAEVRYNFRPTVVRYLTGGLDFVGTSVMAPRAADIVEKID